MSPLNCDNLSSVNFNVSVTNLSPKLYLLNKNDISNAEGSCCSSFSKISSVNPFALSDSVFMCGAHLNVL